MRTYDPGKKPDTGQSRRTSAPAPRLHAAVRRSAVADVPRNPGQPLGAPLTEEMRARPGADFSWVPVHADSADKDTLALQRSIGNAAVSRMPEQARHQHGGWYGHQQSAPAAVQRSAVRDVLSGSGQPLGASLREEMEARLGADFSRVRVHTDDAARASAAEIGARAYTSGSHVVIGPGAADKHTLAHELTHVIQQRQGPVAGTGNGGGLKISDPSDRFEREAEANATWALNGIGPVRREPEGSTASGIGQSAVQRKFDYQKAKWSEENLPPDEFANLLEKASGEQKGATFAVPYRGLFDALKDSSIEIYIDEQTAISDARAKFVLDTTTGEGGILRIAPPDGATAVELRDFAASVTHEMQHALDSITGRFKPKEKPQSMDERKLSSELRAFGVEAAAALKLALGPTYPSSQGKLSQILPEIREDRLTPERNQLAYEFHIMDSYRVHVGNPLAAFCPTGLSIVESKFLERVAGYLKTYGLVEETPTSDEALRWLENNNTGVVKNGLLEGVVLFHNQRPQATTSA